MQIHWPLVISTACQRVGLGMFLCAFLADLCFGLGLSLNFVALATLALLGVGGIASIFHLQTPSRFFNAFSNFKSHLTQEALLTPLLGIALLACGLNGILYDAGGASVVLATVAALLSLAFLVCTGLAYQMGSRPAWNTGFVLGLFLLTAAEAGGIATFAVCLLADGGAPVALSAAVALLTAACIAAQFAYVAHMRHVGYGVDVRANEVPYRAPYFAWIACGVVLTVIAFMAAIALASAAAAFAALAASACGIVAWTVLFFKGALKVKMFPMYPVDLNLDM
ncbi:MAG: DmsC/YnfH family molybdoenzyme membrane anchor subunit [Gordonibacter sp.]|uniref:dimethyl sulfoxide reductase anchor subunit family protein n=4 Tax=Gordonibacter sp. TaxID=1968902 RepID=UPI002FC9551F